MVIWILFCSGHFSSTIRVGRSEDIYQRPNSSLPSFPQQWQPKVKKGWSWVFNRTLWGISYVALCSPGFEFFFRKIIPFGFKFRSRKAGCLNERPKPCRSPWPCLLFHSLPSSSQTKAKGICLWQHYWLFKSRILFQNHFKCV